MTEWKLALPEQVVVTGTSSGLGKEIALLLTSTGVSVYGVDTAAPAEDLASTGNFTVVQGSVTDTGTWRRTIAAVMAGAPGGVVSLGYVGSAAVLDVGVLGDEDIAVWRRTWEVNVLGNVLALQELLPLLTSARYAAVVAVSSVNAQFGEQQLAAYSSSKAALSSAIRTIALDYARTACASISWPPGRCERACSNVTSRPPLTRRGSWPPGKLVNQLAGSRGPTRWHRRLLSCFRRGRRLYSPPP